MGTHLGFYGAPIKGGSCRGAYQRFNLQPFQLMVNSFETLLPCCQFFYSFYCSFARLFFFFFFTAVAARREKQRLFFSSCLQIINRHVNEKFISCKYLSIPWRTPWCREEGCRYVRDWGTLWDRKGLSKRDGLHLSQERTRLLASSTTKAGRPALLNLGESRQELRSISFGQSHPLGTKGKMLLP